EMERQLVAFSGGDELELQACRLGFREHARTIQEGEAWLAPAGESPQATDDVVVRAADQMLARESFSQPPPAEQRNRCRARPGQPALCGRSPLRPGEGRASACCRADPTA